MNDINYNINVVTEIPPAEACARIAAVSNWWTKGYSGHSQQPGDRFTVRFGETFVDFKVTELVPETRIVWHVLNSDIPGLKNRGEWTGTEVIWEVTQQAGTPEAGATRIGMTHVGLAPQVECYEMCQRGWNFYVGESLRRLLTDNSGTPDGRPR